MSDAVPLGHQRCQSVNENTARSANTHNNNNNTVFVMYWYCISVSEAVPLGHQRCQSSNANTVWSANTHNSSTVLRISIY